MYQLRVETYVYLCMYTCMYHTESLFASEHSFIGNIILDFIDYKSSTIPLWSAVILSVLWKAWHFVSKELTAFKESASVKQKLSENRRWLQ